MKIFDYFYENYFVPVVEYVSELFYSLGNFMLNALFVGVLFITAPVWIFPYLIIKYRKERKADNNE